MKTMHVVYVKMVSPGKAAKLLLVAQVHVAIKVSAKKIPGHTGSRCACKPGFAGLACEIEVCPGAKSGKMCSGHGKCSNKQMLAGVESPCSCKIGWGGLKCETPVCPNACSGHGACDLETKKCTCKVGFKGTDCGIEGCDKGYMTKDPTKRCQHQYCTPIDCNGHGECSPKAQKCVCTPGFTGAGCGVALYLIIVITTANAEPVAGVKKEACVTVTKVLVGNIVILSIVVQKPRVPTTVHAITKRKVVNVQ